MSRKSVLSSDNILKRLEDHIVLGSGAMGTMLQAAGLPPGQSPDGWNLECPDKVAAVHRAYLQAGSEVLLTNTFGANRPKLEEFGLADRLADICRAAARLARAEADAAAAGGLGSVPRRGRALVAGSIGPTGRFLEPLGPMTFDEAYRIFFEQARALEEGGADFLVIETMADLAEIRAAVIAAREATDLPVVAQMTFNPDGRTFTGTDAATAAVVLDALGADVIGANCSGGPDELAAVIRAMARVTRRPLSLVPNAGLPRLEGGRTVFPMDAEQFAARVPALLEAGAVLIGGCCGTTPDHLRAVSRELQRLDLRPGAGSRGSLGPPGTTPLALAGRTRSLLFVPENLPVIIGERLNPTARKKLAADAREGRFELYRREARVQAEAGASILDVNVGVPGIDEPRAMREAVMAVQGVTDLPLSIDSSNPEALEAGLKVFAGKALVNSVTGEEERLRTVLPLVRRYGAAVIALTLDDAGIPMTAQGRLAVAGKILERALALGIPRENLIFDPLVLTAGAQAREAMETPRAVRLIKEQLGLPCVLGISNVSFGLPRRDILNSAYLTANLAHGLDAAIANPLEPRVWEAVRAMRLLLFYDTDAAGYISYVSSLPAPAGAGPTVPGDSAVSVTAAAPAAVGKAPPSAGTDDPGERIRAAISDGDREGIVALVEAALSAGAAPMDLVEKVLIPSLEEIGEGFGAGRIFLPQMMLAAEAMKRAFARLQPELPRDGAREMGTVVLATVEGDIHDIGKNIVSVLLENYGFRVVDLGKSVPAEEIVRAASEAKADIIGLSALMTTTMPQMRKVIDEAKAAGLSAKVLIGGAVTTQGYAREIGADGHGRDARAAIELCRQFLSGKK